MGGGGGGEWGGSGFLEKCSLLVDRLGHTSECYIEIQQRRERWVPLPPLLPHLWLRPVFIVIIVIVDIFFVVVVISWLSEFHLLDDDD